MGQVAVCYSTLSRVMVCWLVVMPLSGHVLARAVRRGWGCVSLPEELQRRLEQCGSKCFGTYRCKTMPMPWLLVLSLLLLLLLLFLILVIVACQGNGRGSDAGRTLGLHLVPLMMFICMFAMLPGP